MIGARQSGTGPYRRETPVIPKGIPVTLLRSDRYANARRTDLLRRTEASAVLQVYLIGDAALHVAHTN